MADGLDQGQASAYCSLGVMLMGLWVAEIDQYAIAHVPSDKAVEAADRLGDAIVVRAQNVAQVFRIEPRRQRCRADHIAEHY